MKKIGLIVAFCAVMGSVWAIPARRGGIVKTQPDGSEIVVYQHGDEHFHWMTNEEGEWIRLDEDGFYRVTDALTTEEIQAKRMSSPMQIAPKQEVGALNIAPRGLVILVNFADLQFETDSAEMNSMLTGENYSREYKYLKGKKYVYINSVGSARQYFHDASFGQYNPEFDVVGPVTVSKEMAYYGKNNYSGSDSNPHIMVKEACEVADSVWNVDFSRYDNDNDGKVDFVYIIYAGYGEADGGASNTIWPHSWYLSAGGAYCSLDGKRVDLYACGNEMNYVSKHHTGIGTFCHEFSHVLGLPDMYATDGGTHKTLGDWSILDAGPYNNDGNTPPTFSAYERFYMGWLTPRLITESENIILEELSSTNTALLISPSDEHNMDGLKPNPVTFYMLENRQQTGWDTHIPGHGLMLTKIQYTSRKWTANTVNNTSSSMGVDLIEADGKTSTNKSGKAEDLFPAGATEYTKITDHPIENITEVDSVISFMYRDTINTAVEYVEAIDQVVAVYNILGQKQPTNDVSTLPRGTYIVVTTKGNRKIIR